MIFGHQQCSRCDGAIPREHFAREPLVGYEVTYLYCEFCGVGVETLWVVTQTDRFEEFSLEYDRSDPIKLGMLLQQLHDRRAA